MDLYLGIGKYKGKTWREVESNDPAFINWTANNSSNKDWRDFANILISRRVKVEVKTEWFSLLNPLITFYKKFEIFIIDNPFALVIYKN